MPKRKASSKDTKTTAIKKSKQDPKVQPKVPPEVQPEVQPEVPPEVPPEAPPEAPGDKLIKSWFKNIRYLASDQIQSIYMLRDNTNEINAACETLWTRVDMENIFVNIWNDVNNVLEDEIDTHSELLDLMLGVIEERMVREKLLEMIADAGIEKKELWERAGKVLWTGWTEELKYIKL